MEWLISDRPVAYPAAVAFMERRVEAIRERRAAEAVWLLEHPPLYTAGTSARDAELLAPDRLPVYRTGRGGRYTYHGPGQRIAYVMLDLRPRGSDLRLFVGALEAWLIATLARFGVRGECRAGRVGVWVDVGGGRDAKIAAVGVRVRRWISYHGVALNVNPDLAHFAGIVPCGLAGHGVTSLAALGIAARVREIDAALRETFAPAFAAAAPEPCRRDGPTAVIPSIGGG
ncbi:MAG: lipoyl(octanoyl) transferase LipB [Rhodospirillales bacterium]